MAITLTENAATEIRRVIQETPELQDESAVLRVGISGGGCSGFQYNLGFDNKADKAADHISEQHGITVVIDKKSELFLDGTTLDFHQDLQRRGFTFDNPNAVKTCGCGSSFSA